MARNWEIRTCSHQGPKKQLCKDKLKKVLFLKGGQQMGNQNQWPAARAYNRRGANTFHTPGDPYGISGFVTVWI